MPFSISFLLNRFPVFRFRKQFGINLKSKDDFKLKPGASADTVIKFAEIRAVEVVLRVSRIKVIRYVGNCTNLYSND